MATLTDKTVANTYDQLWFRGSTQPGATTNATQVLTTENDGTDDLSTPLYLGLARIGIGTSSPSEVLDVTGNIKSSGTGVFGGALTCVTSLTIGSAAMVEADLEKLDGITNGTAAASKALVLDSNKDIGTIRNLTIDGVFTDGNYTFDTSGNVSGLGTVGCGAITTSGTLDYNNGTIDLSTQTVAVTLNSAANALNFDSNTLTIDASANRVGIGTDAPGEKLEVYADDADVAIKIHADANDAAALHFRSGALDWFLICDVGTSENTLAFKCEDSEKVTFQADGKVGIGTAEPGYLLDLSSGAAACWMATDTTEDGHDSGLLLRQNGGTKGVCAYDDDNNTVALVYDTASTSTKGLNIDYTGKVGIGTAEPGNNLEVKSVTGSNAYIRVNTTDSDDSTSDAGILLAEAGTNKWNLYNDGSDSDKLKLNDKDGDTWITILQDTGNVGIGTAEPSTVLSVISDLDAGELGFNVKHSNLTVGIAIGYQRIKSVGTDTNSSIYIDGKGSGNLLLQTVATGNVGIGTNTPDSLLEVSKDAANIVYITCYDDTETSTGALHFRKAEGTEASHASPLDDDAHIGEVGFWGWDGDQFLQGASILAKINTPASSPSDGSMPTDLEFHTNTGTEAAEIRMIIKENGYVGIGETEPDRVLHVKSATSDFIAVFENNSDPNPTGIHINYTTANSTSTTAHEYIKCEDVGGAEFKVYGDGSYANLSDIRVKENIVDTASQIDNINKIRIIDYNRITDPDKSKHIGIIAQELEEIYPHLVRTNDDENKTKMIYKQGLVPMLIKAIQELSAEVEKLKNG